MPVKGLLAGFNTPVAKADPTEAVDSGMKAYTEMAGVRQREQNLALQGQQGAREERRLGMAEQLMPGQLTAQQQANKAQQQTIEAAAQQMSRDQVQRQKAAEFFRKARAGEFKDPLDAHFELGDITIAGGKADKTAEWLGVHQKMLQTGKDAEQLRALFSTYLDGLKASADNPKDPMVWGRIVEKMLKESPMGIAQPNQPFFKLAQEQMNKAVDAKYPRAVAEGWKKYVDMVAGMPDLTPAQRWSKVLAETDPNFHAELNKLAPPEVKAEYGALAKGAEKGAEARAELPSKLAVVKETGAQQRLLEAEKEKGREARALRPAKDQEKLLADATKRLGQIETRLKDPYLGDEDRAQLEADRTTAIRERREYQENLVLARDREGEKKSDQLDPNKVRAEAIGPFTTQLRQKSKSLEYSKAALDLSLKNRKISKAEYDQLLASETKRFETKK
ncbi:MAG: hypothetical protein A2V88_05670 [Elusimicrobia bacterium RBG_16_66_12]|nr:MAG: hypothetical protein A2V88_05670 [Elusimicrobia bacterium RBG_16_66_12]